MHDLEPLPESFRLSESLSRGALLDLPEGLKPSGRGSRFVHKSLILNSPQTEWSFVPLWQKQYQSLIFHAKSSLIKCSHLKAGSVS